MGTNTTCSLKCESPCRFHVITPKTKLVVSLKAHIYSERPNQNQDCLPLLLFWSWVSSLCVNTSFCSYLFMSCYCICRYFNYKGHILLRLAVLASCFPACRTNGGSAPFVPQLVTVRLVLLHLVHVALLQAGRLQ